MTRPYLNQISFHAPDVNSALEHLEKLRVAIARLLKDDLLSLPVMCSYPASQLAITPDYKVITQMIGHQGGRFRDTILFFLQVLDQRAPVYGGSAEEIESAAKNHIVDGVDADASSEETMALICCGLEGGVLLSLASEDRWRSHLYNYSVLLDGSDEFINFESLNVSEPVSAESVAAILEVRSSELKLENWVKVTGGANKTKQVTDWLEETERSPGLTQLVLRTLNAAMESDYYCDGELVKKLKGAGGASIYEVRAYYRGSNNVRILFTRSGDGSVTYWYGGQKTSPGWYEHAIGQVGI